MIFDLRAKSMLAKDQTDPENHVLPKLGFFLASKDEFAKDIKNALATMSDTYETIFCDLIMLCADIIESEKFLLPNHKHIYLRASAYAIFLIDGDGEEKDFVKKKKFKVDRIGKLFRANSIVPLFGDLTFSLGSLTNKCPHWNHLKWDLERNDPEIKEDLKIKYLIDCWDLSFQEEHKFFVERLRKAHFQFNGRKEVATTEEAQNLYHLIYSILKFMSSLTNKITEQSAWKYLNPNGAIIESSIYEQSVQYNYQNEEKKILIQYISTIKALANMLQSMKNTFQPILDTHIYTEIQSFTQIQITDNYNSATKKKKHTASLLKVVKDSLHQHRTESVSTSTEVAQVNPASPTQLFFARSGLELMISEKSKGMKGGMLKEKDFKESQVVELQKFLDDSLHYAEMLSLSTTIRECSDLSNLWFKEFYLELTKQVQFRTSTSLPWILAEFILESQESNIFLDLLIPLDLYNDAAYKTLYSLKSQFIFNEIEAEINLCFDRFMFDLGKKVFTHYKKRAAILVLDAETKLGKNDLFNDTLDSSAYECILKQSNVRILGRNIDMKKVLAQIVGQYLRISIDTAISRFEASEVTYVLQLESLIETSRMTHKLLSKLLELENFDDLVKEVNQQGERGEGRIVAHIVQELVREVVPTYGFNIVTSRFLKGSVFYADPVQRPNFTNARWMFLYGAKNLSNAFSLKFGCFKDYVGEIHFASIIRLIGLPGLADVLTELTNHVTLILDNTWRRFCDTILEASPSSLQYPVDFDKLHCKSRLIHV
jgi:cytoplasmic FMR1 interacting protein